MPVWLTYIRVWVWPCPYYLFSVYLKQKKVYIVIILERKHDSYVSGRDSKTDLKRKQIW